MFKRRWKWFGRLVSDEGFAISYGHKSVIYSDPRGSFVFGLEDGFLFPPPRQSEGNRISLTECEINVMTEHVLDGLRADGHDVRVHKGKV